MANQPMDVITKVLEKVEEQVDAELGKLNELEEDDLERLKEKRLEALKKAQKQKQVSVVLLIYNYKILKVNFPKHFHNYKPNSIESRSG